MPTLTKTTACLKSPAMWRAHLERVREELAPALSDTAKRLGLASLTLGRCTYDPQAGSFRFKLEGLVEGGLDNAALRYDAARHYNPGWPERGATVTFAGRLFTVTGLGTGGAIYGVNPAGTAYRLGRAAWDRKFGESGAYEEVTP